MRSTPSPSTSGDAAATSIGHRRGRRLAHVLVVVGLVPLSLVGVLLVLTIFGAMLGVALLAVTVGPAIGLVSAARAGRPTAPRIVGLIWFDVALSGLALVASLVFWDTTWSTRNSDRVWQLPVVGAWWLAFASGAMLLRRPDWPRRREG